jgi:hypothetical protein
MFELSAIAWRHVSFENPLSALSPEASGPIRQVIPRFPLGVGQPDQHPGCGLPRNSAVGVQVPHGVTSFFALPKDGGDQIRFRVVGTSIFDVLVFDIDPESQNSRHAEFHGGPGFDRFGIAVTKLAYQHALSKGRPFAKFRHMCPDTVT